MCGRYSLIADIRELQAYFGFVADELDVPPRYNIAPTQPALTLVAEMATRVGRRICAGGWCRPGRRTSRSAAA